MSASLFDLAMIWYQIDPGSLPHNFSVYVPKSESAEEAFWWRDLFQALAKQKGLPRDYIKCMALVEAHPLAYQMEEFLFNLREHCLGLNLDCWDYMASLIHFMIEDPTGFCRIATLSPMMSHSSRTFEHSCLRFAISTEHTPSAE